MKSAIGPTRRVLRERLTREESKAVTRARVLEAAAEVFARRGFHGASVEEVAETAGYSKGAVYSNFASKEDLFLALLDQRLDAQMEAFAAVFATELTPPARLDALGRMRTPTLDSGRDWCLLATEFWLYAAREPKIGPRLAVRRRLARERVAQLIEAHTRESGGAPTGHPEELAALIIAIGDGLQMQTYVEPTMDSDGLFRLALALILGSTSVGEAGP